MKKTICRALLCLLLAACLLPLTARTAHADKIYDEIVNYQVDVTPNTEDGSLAIQVTLDWKPLEDLPATNSQKGGAKIGIPNGSIREMTALTDNIQSIDHDNSYAYIDFTQGYSANETFHFAFRWVQEYMYTLSDSGAVSYDYTPGWFDSAPAGAGTTALGPGRSGRLRAFLLGLGLLDGQIDFPLRGEGEDLYGDLLPLGEVVVDVADKGSGHL